MIAVRVMRDSGTEHRTFGRRIAENARLAADRAITGSVGETPPSRRGQAVSLPPGARRERGDGQQSNDEREHDALTTRVSP